MLTVYCLTVRPVSSVRHCREEGRIRALWSTIVPPTVSTSLCLCNLTSKEVQRSAVLLTEATTASCLSPSQTRARRQELHHHPATTRVGWMLLIMLKSLFVYGVLGVLLTPAKCSEIIVCIEEDDDLRVDCLIDSKIGQINDYEFSWSSGTKEVILNTNVSGSHADSQFKDKKSYVTELSPKGYRLTVEDTKDKLPYNTTYICKVSGVSAQAILQKEQLAPCSAVSVFLQSSSSWIVCLLLFYQMQS